MNWLIIRTDHSKEAYVARQIGLLGFEAWVPSEIRAIRPHCARRVTAKAAVSIRELPLLPKRIMAAVPQGIHGKLLEIRHMVAVERDAALAPLQIPANQVLAFRAEIDRLNTATLALASKPTRKEKAVWKDIKEALQDMIEQARERLEVAA